MPETIRVLCVDDEIKILNVFRRQLFDEDYEVHAALTVEEGLEILGRIGPVHVVLSDYRMPGMNGLEFLGKVAGEWPSTVGIIISGYADVPAVQHALEVNELFQFIAKPWKAEEMRRAIARAADLSRTRLIRTARTDGSSKEAESL